MSWDYKYSITISMATFRYSPNPHTEKRVICVTYQDVESLVVYNVCVLKKRSQRLFLPIMSSEYTLQDFVYEPENHHQIFNVPVNEHLKLGLISQSWNGVNTILLFVVFLEQPKHINLLLMTTQYILKFCQESFNLSIISLILEYSLRYYYQNKTEELKYICKLCWFWISIYNLYTYQHVTCL